MLAVTIDQGPVLWRPAIIKWRQFSQSNRYSTIGTRQTEYHEALPSSVNDEVRCDCMFADDGNASWYSVCRLPMVEWRLDCEDCSHLTVVGLHDTGLWTVLFHSQCSSWWSQGQWKAKPVGFSFLPACQQIRMKFDMVLKQFKQNIFMFI